MLDTVKLDRRAFLVGSAAAGAGLSLGFGVSPAAAQGTPPEINAWVVIRPDDTVVIRIARSEASPSWSRKNSSATGPR